MAYVLKKRGRYLTGHSYATGFSYSFSWSKDEGEARRFADDDPSVDGFANQTGAKIVHVDNTKQELARAQAPEGAGPARQITRH